MMETPICVNQNVPRQYSLRLSERKKKLFANRDNEKSSRDDGDLLEGIQPIKQFSQGTPRRRSCKDEHFRDLLSIKHGTSFSRNNFEEINDDDNRGTDIHNSEKDRVTLSVTPVRQSQRLLIKQQQESDYTNNRKRPHFECTKTSITVEDEQQQQLRKMFHNSMRLSSSPAQTVNDDMIVNETILDSSDSSVYESPVGTRSKKKRHCSDTDISPKRKKRKTKAKSPQMYNKPIPTKSFYPTTTKTIPISKGKENQGDKWNCPTLLLLSPISSRSFEHLKERKRITRRSISGGSRRRSGITRHKITKNKVHSQPLELEDLLGNIRNEKLRHLIISKREAKKQVENVHKIMRESGNPIAMATPLSSLANHYIDDSNNNNNGIEAVKQNSFMFSDTSDSEEEEEKEQLFNSNRKASATTSVDNDSIIPFIKYDNTDIMQEDGIVCETISKRKFFKSGYTNHVPKQVQITNNIKAMVTENGKLRLVSETEKKEKKHRKKSRKGLHKKMSNEQAIVDSILQKLDDSTYGETINTTITNNRKQEQTHLQQQQQLERKDNDDQQKLITIDNTTNVNCPNEINAIEQHTQEMQQEIVEVEYQPQGENEKNDLHYDNTYYVNVLAKMPEYKKFFERLPYNTNDPDIIERQHILLEFLITNNICTEENFTIFITDPDNHKEEAERIVNELVMIIGDDDEIQTDNDVEEAQAQTNEQQMQQEHEHSLSERQVQLKENSKIDRQQETINEGIQMDVVIENHSKNVNSSIEIQQNQQQELQQLIVTIENDSQISINSNLHDNNNHKENCQQQQEKQQKIFPIFLKNSGYKPLRLSDTKHAMTKSQRCWNGGYGMNQYQIDAGQKQFGATQCKQCGLLYTMHEPEEEKLHRDFHASINLLRFKGWLDEDVVVFYPEWGADGRILRITNESPPKRRQKLKDVLNVVDKELGYASYIIPKSYVAYFAVRLSQIVGLCLVQPLEKANKYVCINGVDCCTQEEFNVRCGISRIWVAPLHRRLHIASELLKAVRRNTILGRILPWDQIAFSAPTQMGKIFAQKVTNTENFLVYS